MSTPGSTLGFIRAPIVDKDGNLQPGMMKWLQRLEAKTNQALTLAGQIAASTQIQGRSEGIGTTASQLNSSGKLLSTDSIAADGSGSPLTGGKRGFQALDANNRLAGTQHNNPVNVTAIPANLRDLGNNGLSTAIIVAADTYQRGNGTTAYSSGSVDPGVYGDFYVYTDDPTFAGVSIYQASANLQDAAAANGRVKIGGIHTASGSGGTGGGGTGGGTNPHSGGGGGYS